MTAAPPTAPPPLGPPRREAPVTAAQRFRWLGEMIGLKGMIAAAAISLLGGALWFTADLARASATQMLGLGRAVEASWTCLAREAWQLVAAGQVPPAQRFRVVIARLDHDHDGTYTRTLAGAFRGERSFEVRESCLGIGASHDMRLQRAEAEGLEAARALARRTGAHLVIWGEVAGAGEHILRLWFTNPGEPTEAGPRDWRLEGGLLGQGFQDQFAATIQAIALGALRPVVETGDAARMAELSDSLVPRLWQLAERPPSSFSVGQRDELRLVLADALVLAARWGRDRGVAGQAVSLYRAMLVDGRERDRLERAMLRHRIGLALLAGDPSISAATADTVVEELGAALAAYGEAGRDLQWWLVFERLPGPLRAVAGAGEAALRRAVALLQGELRRIDVRAQEVRWRKVAEETALTLLDLGASGDRVALQEAEALLRAILPLTPASERWSRAWIKAMLARTLLRIGEDGPDEALQEAVALLDEALPALPEVIASRDGHVADRLAALGLLQGRGHVAAFVRLVGVARDRLRKAAAEHPAARAEAQLDLSELLVSFVRGRRGEVREGVALAEQVLESGAGLGPIPADDMVPETLLRARLYMCLGLWHLAWLGEEGRPGEALAACEAVGEELHSLPEGPERRDLLEKWEYLSRLVFILVGSDDRLSRERALIEWLSTGDRAKRLEVDPRRLRFRSALNKLAETAETRAEAAGQEERAAFVAAAREGLAAAEEKLAQPGVARQWQERAWLLLEQAESLAMLGALGDEAAAQRALTHFEQAEAAIERLNAPFLWSRIRVRTAESLLLLAPTLGGDTLAKARRAATEARDALLELDAPAFLRDAEALLAEVPPDQ
ncbi:hypothetical protein [Falsiroseomonas sp.]|uniref:hypothetical protein n=1 Tax=Falsiroseomonas sp. TaxID=2870721 RepID=UPI0035659AED